jgi:hypothetical protein
VLDDDHGRTGSQELAEDAKEHSGIQGVEADRRLVEELPVNAAKWPLEVPVAGTLA